MEELLITGCRRHGGKDMAGGRKLGASMRTRIEVIMDERELEPVVVTVVNRDRGMMGYSALWNFLCGWKTCTVQYCKC